LDAEQYGLSKEEQDILKMIDVGSRTKKSSDGEKNEYIQAAHNTLKKEQ
jgi:hypothetical protein